LPAGGARGVHQVGGTQPAEAGRPRRAARIRKLRWRAGGETWVRPSGRDDALKHAVRTMRGILGVPPGPHARGIDAAARKGPLRGVKCARNAEQPWMSGKGDGDRERKGDLVERSRELAGCTRQWGTWGGGKGWGPRLGSEGPKARARDRDKALVGSGGSRLGRSGTSKARVRGAYALGPGALRGGFPASAVGRGKGRRRCAEKCRFRDVVHVGRWRGDGRKGGGGGRAAWNRVGAGAEGPSRKRGPPDHPGGNAAAGNAAPQ